MSRKLTLEHLYLPTGSSLGSLFAGLSGSGKTTATISTLQQAGKLSSFGEFHRFCVVDPKGQPGDYDLLAEPVFDVSSALKSVRKNRFTVFWPSIETLELDVTEFVDGLFDMADSEPRSSYTFVLDEASILITPTQIPDALKRLAVQGRAKHIKPIFISQRPIVNRWTDANISNMLLFRTLPVDADTLGRRWGIDFGQADETIRERQFSYLWFDLEDASLNPMEPTPLPTIPKKKPTFWQRLSQSINL